MTVNEEAIETTKIVKNVALYLDNDLRFTESNDSEGLYSIKESISLKIFVEQKKWKQL